MDTKIKDIPIYENRTTYGYELTFDVKYWLKWHNDYWSISIVLSAMYVFACIAGQKWMESRKPYNLRSMLSLWSFVLAVFSIMGACKMVPELLSVLLNDGFHASVCRSSYVNNVEQLFWHWLFVWSKLFEFGDTAFIILRKQKLTFLHWYHHALTLICCFSFFPSTVGINRWTGTMNYFVHSFMYSYYSAKAMKITFPKLIPMFITTIQILQMFIGLFASVYTVAMKFGGFASQCNISKGQSLFVFCGYLSYFILFLNFFINSYFIKKTQAKKLN
ncbi:elongation of very long chain fatty acids protein 6-like protein [Leptotrombidium deliense]|uniref:Elongation of very long chain fatty acids protein n=1 Tax=Leptotrombidium deliense TaxID=299467 RepID=A0A443S8K1_9ACAR|nr:elongation of very long chain fatty acids protein 6-like protein [Leptotrombidium deliense]